MSPSLASMFAGPRTFLYGKASSFQRRCLNPKIYTSSRRCKTTKIQRTTSTDKGKGIKVVSNAGEKGATRQPKAKASNGQNLPIPLAIPDSTLISQGTYSTTIQPFLPRAGGPIPEIRPPPAKWREGAPPPQFIVDLDLSPTKRWGKVMEWGAPLLRSVIHKFHTPKEQSLWKNELMQSIERRYSFSNDQYAEMEGIAALSDIPFHKIIDYNLTLTSQFGCTSGTVPLMDPSRLLHFRVLDPGIALPQLLIQVHFVRRQELVASAITHVGHVAITTGVRKGLSISINTRADYVMSRGLHKWWSRFKWAMHDPWCISTRELLLREPVPSLRTAKAELERGMPDAFFSVVSNGQEAASLDGPNPEEQEWREPQNGVLVQGNHYADTSDRFLLDAALPGTAALMEKNTARVRRLENLINQSIEENKGAGVKMPDLVKWVTSPPVKQSATTLACIMDPTEGNILWAASYKGQ